MRDVKATILSALFLAILSGPISAQEPQQEKVKVSGNAAKSTTQNNLVVVCKLDGTATIIKVVPDGTQVNQGDLLIEFDDSQLRQSLMNLRVEIAGLKATSAEAGAPDASTGERLVKGVELELKIAQLRSKQVEAELRLEQITAGIVRHHLPHVAKKGAMVREGQPILVLERNDPAKPAGDDER